MKPTRRAQRGRQAFTLTEVMVATAIGGMVIAGMLSLFVSFVRSYTSTTLLRNTSGRSSLALERMVYGVGTNTGLRAAKTSTVAVTFPSGGWRLAYNSNLVFQYTVAAKTITDQTGRKICSNVVASTLLYYTNRCDLSISVAESAGGRISTNTMRTLVTFRN